MSCYLCSLDINHLRKGVVRDAPEMQVIECDSCGLVYLNSIDHIEPGFYENSGMHSSDLVAIDTWLRDVDWDDSRRFEMLKTVLPNINLLDFGCGAAGFLRKAQSLVTTATGIELETRVREYWGASLNIVPTIEAASQVCDGYDLITAFHVVEHLSDPREVLRELASLLKPKGRIILEVPSADDILISLYNNESFQRFTYWSQHLFLFNTSTLNKLARQAGLRAITIQHYQRYPLSNHLYWLSKGKAGGHKCWSFIDTPEISQAYANALAAIGKTDTLIAHLELA